VVAVCFFVIRNTAPPLTTCGEKNLRAKKKRSGTHADALKAKTPRTLLDFETETLSKLPHVFVEFKYDGII
jgi:hypothetical protein